jgi:restriction endonuclease Mrr
MNPKNSSTIATLFLGILIATVTAACLIALRESVLFQSLLAILFAASAAYAIISTSVQSRKNQISHRFFDTLFSARKTAKRSDFSKKTYEETDTLAFQEDHDEENNIHLESLIDFAQPTSEVDTVELSLDQYLEMIDFHLNDQILAAIEWKRFELLCHLLFQASGHSSQITTDGADEGVDIRIYDENTSTLLYLVQCKKWQTHCKIDRPLIQQLRGQMAAENVSKGRYCITSSFTLPAIEFANANGIELYDKQKIIQIFNNLATDIRSRILNELLDGDYWTPSCATCGQKFKPATTKNGKLVWACNRGSGSHGWNSIGYYEAAPITDVR